MSRITQAGTAGVAILPEAWHFIRERGDIPDADKLPPEQRHHYDAGSPSDRSESHRLTSLAYLTLPDFLSVTADDAAQKITHSLGAKSESEGHLAGGRLSEQLVPQAIKGMGISAEQLMRELARFSGAVGLYMLSDGTALYRSIDGLAAKVTQGSLLNPLLGGYWLLECPSNYLDEAAWRAATASPAEWKGAQGYLKVQLCRPVLALSGKVGRQKITGNNNTALPGGALQAFIPQLTDADLVTSTNGRPVSESIQATHFGHRTL